MLQFDCVKQRLEDVFSLKWNRSFSRSFLTSFGYKLSGRMMGYFDTWLHKAWRSVVSWTERRVFL